MLLCALLVRILEIYLIMQNNTEPLECWYNVIDLSEQFHTKQTSLKTPMTFNMLR